MGSHLRYKFVKTKAKLFSFTCENFNNGSRLWLASATETWRWNVKICRKAIFRWAPTQLLTLVRLCGCVAVRLCGCSTVCPKFCLKNLNRHDYWEGPYTYTSRDMTYIRRGGRTSCKGGQTSCKVVRTLCKGGRTSCKGRRT